MIRFRGWVPYCEELVSVDDFSVSFFSIRRLPAFPATRKFSHVIRQILILVFSIFSEMNKLPKFYRARVLLDTVKRVKCPVITFLRSDERS